MERERETARRGRVWSMKRNVECTVGYGHIRHGAHVELCWYKGTVAVFEMAYCCPTYCTCYGAWEISFCLERLCAFFFLLNCALTFGPLLK